MRTREYAAHVGVSEQCVRQWIDRQLIEARPLIVHGRLCYDIDPDTPRPAKETSTPRWLDGRRTGRRRISHKMTAAARKRGHEIGRMTQQEQHQTMKQLAGQMHVNDLPDAMDKLSKNQALSTEEFLKLCGDDVPPWV